MYRRTKSIIFETHNLEILEALVKHMKSYWMYCPVLWMGSLSKLDFAPILVKKHGNRKSSGS
jgi:hypothetical protein